MSGIVVVVPVFALVVVGVVMVVLFVVGLEIVVGVVVVLIVGVVILVILVSIVLSAAVLPRKEKTRRTRQGDMLISSARPEAGRLGLVQVAI